MKPVMRCIDVNSQQCPCLLADTNHCFICSHLKGEAVCDCDWTGKCILHERHWQVPRKPSDTHCRREVETTLVTKRRINENIFIVESEVGAELAQQLDQIGSFVFLRQAADLEMCNFPVGIMDVNGGIITMVIERIGPKSSRVLQQTDVRVLIRGPYRNGVLGQPWIDSTKYGTILAAIGGLGQANALMLAKQVLANNNKVTFVVAPGQAGSVFVAGELSKMGVDVITVPSMRREGFARLQELFSEQVDLLLSAGPDDLHYALIEAMHASGYNYPMAVTNNATMCCGEGICGSCAKKTKSGEWIRTCKIQLDFDQLDNTRQV